MAPGLDLAILSREEVRKYAFPARSKSSDREDGTHSSEYPELSLKRVEGTMSSAITRRRVSANKLNLEFGLLDQVEKIHPIFGSSKR
jgi:hypothetical protein